MKSVFPIRNWCLSLAGLILTTAPAYAEMRPDKLAAIDTAIEAAISANDIPGAVLWLESRGEVYQKAYGNRMIFPSAEKMSPGTVFDVASLTKVFSTAPAILHLYERGLLHIDAPVSRYIPEFLEGGVLEESLPKEGVTLTEEEKENLVTPEHRKLVTVLQLLTHNSGLPPGIFLSKQDFWGHDEGVRRAYSIGLKESPGSRFRYSDVNYILLGEIVRRVSGKRVDEYVRETFYEPLNMWRTGYLPPDYRKAGCAPTTFIDEYGLLRGEVHDPTARRMEGVAGHAGLFSTAEDLAKFLRFYLATSGGKTNTILDPESVRLATRDHMPAPLGIQRGLGWDISSGFAYQRGERFPREGFGHTGWTGTSVWADPASDTFLILLANRNHPSESGRIKQLRIRVGTLAGEAVGYSNPVPLTAQQKDDDGPASRTAADGGTVLNGIDVLEKEDFSRLAGLRVGLITNHTGINRQRRSTIDLLDKAPGVELVALFSPEHGIRGALEVDSIEDGKDAATGLPIHSLYKSKERKPTPAQLEGLDALVFDIQDIGCRYYTYVSTMGLAMEAAAEKGIRFIVLDRVNPIGGMVVDGPIRSGTGNDFVAFHDIPIQHGMTAGELARMFQEEKKLKLELTVVPISGWDPRMRFDDTGLPWVNPSPNMRSVTEALLYPGIGLLEFTNISVGRGTATPFEHIGAPWIDHGKLSRELRDESLPGVMLIQTQFTPEASKYEGEDCGGLRFLITSRDEFRPLDLGLALGRSLEKLYPSTFDLEKEGNVLLRHQPTLDALLKGKSNEEIRRTWEPGLEKFLKRRDKFLLYPR